MSSYTDDRQVRLYAIGIDEREITLTFMLSDDVRDGGKVAQQRMIAVRRRHPQYRDEIEALVEAAEDLVRDITQDWADKEPMKPDEEDDGE